MLLKTIGKFVSDQVKPLQDRIAKLEAQIEELQAKGINFCGTYQRANGYRRGEWVTYDSSGWVALTDVPPLEIPGKSASWQLILRGYNDAPRQPTRGGPRPETTIQRRTP